MFELKVTDHFDAAHYLRDYPGKCKNMHGHTWEIEVQVKGDALNELGLLIDFSDLKKIVKGILEPLDHRLINEIPPFDRINPSSENLARYFYEAIKSRLAQNSGAYLAKVSVSESRTTKASYYEKQS